MSICLYKMGIFILILCCGSTFRSIFCYLGVIKMSLINVSNLTFGYDGSGKNIFENVSFQIDTNWNLGLTGRNGRGKTTFFKLLKRV